MAALKTAKAREEVERIEQTEFEADLPVLIKEAEDLYVPSNFDVDHNYYSDPEGKKPYMGITSILKVLAKPALVPWAANMAVDHIGNNIPLCFVENGGKWNPIKFSEVLEEARVVHRKKKESAGELGTEVHAEIEAYINYCIAQGGVAVPLKAEIKEEVAPQTALFANWAVVNGVEFLASEKRLYSKKLWVAGTADFVARIFGRLVIGDIKTSSAIYPENFIQTTAYAFMAREMGLYDDFKGVVIVNLPKRGGITVKENYDLKGNFAAFKACLTLHKFLNSQKVKKIKK